MHSLQAVLLAQTRQLGSHPVGFEGSMVRPQSVGRAPMAFSPNATLIYWFTSAVVAKHLVWSSLVWPPGQAEQVALGPPGETVPAGHDAQSAEPLATDTPKPGAQVTGPAARRGLKARVSNGDLCY